MNILIHPNEILRKKCTPVEEISNELVLTAYEMMKLMKASGGIGLAAPQVGISERFFVMDTTEQIVNGEVVPNPDGFKGILFNPYISARGLNVMPYVEGCLSFPKAQQPTCRASFIEVQYVDEYKKIQKVKLHGISAICAAHEIDHLNGVLFIDYNQTGSKKRGKRK